MGISMGVSKSRQPQHRAVVLVSGGLDSATALAVARSDGFETYALSFDYGQRHSAELDAARRVVDHLEADEHIIIDLNLRPIARSALTSEDIPVPKGRGDEGGRIPSTYVPARNTVFLAIALAWAETLGADAIYLGVSAVDYSGYPDCRPEYLDAFQAMADLATKQAVEDGMRIEIKAPLVGLSKAETVSLGLSLGVDYSLTVSCYDADDEGRACGECDSCRLRRRAFIESDTNDPTDYQSNEEVPDD